MTRLLVIIALAWAGVVAVLVGLTAAFTPRAGLADVFLFMGPVTKLCLITAILVGVLGIIGGLSRATTLTRIASGMAVLLGLLGAAFSELMTQMTIADIGPVSFAVTAPSRVEALLCLAVGLGAALIALGLLQWRKARPVISA